MKHLLKIVIYFCAVISCLDCKGYQGIDSITLYTMIDTTEGFIRLRKNKVKYFEDGNRRVDGKFYIDLPVGLEDLSYQHIGNANYCIFSFANNAKIIVEVSLYNRDRAASKGVYRVDYLNFIKHYSSVTNKEKLTFVKTPEDYIKSQEKFGIVKKGKYLIYYLHVASSQVDIFDKSIQSLRKKFYKNYLKKKNMDTK
jgi:hypothetical protein